MSGAGSIAGPAPADIMNGPALPLLEIIERLGVGPWSVPTRIVVPRGASLDAMCTGATHDSRAIRPGFVFCCVPGAHADGHNFAQNAAATGAVALLVGREVRTDPPIPQLVVGEVRAAMGPLAAAINGDPSHFLDVVGVTGTNGKTTTTHLLVSILRAAGRTPASIGTLTHSRTTPEATDLQRHLAELRSGGTDSVAMEVSSHALALHRVDGTRFRVGVFTNLTQDHLDFHASMEAYFRAKARLFELDFVDAAAINADDPHGQLLLDVGSVPSVAFRLTDAEQLTIGRTSSRFVWRGVAFELPLGGAFNVSNALAAATAAALLDIDVPVIAEGIRSAGPVPGRFESIDVGQPYGVIVDYAHTPDGLARVLDSARAGLAAGGRVIVVFGCGGDRDRGKRPLMGEVATRMADVAILTSDNPRSEDPHTIIEEARAGARHPERLTIEVDRRAAIALAISGAAPGDIVVVAGKGHETGQDIGGVVTPFDDRAVVADEIRGVRR